MKNPSVFIRSLKYLLIATLIIIAFFRGENQIWFLAGAFCVWGLIILGAFLAQNRSKIAKYCRKRLMRKPKSAPTPKPKPFVVPDLSEPPERILLRHVNCRITEKLKSAFPEATWDWCEDRPVTLAVKGGTGKIKTSNTGPYNFADVSIDQYARIRFNMMQVVPLESIEEVSEETATTVEPVTTVLREPEPVVDVEVWYEIMGRDLLCELITDLNARGHSTLYIKENGDVCITENHKEVPQETLDNLPGKKFWPELAKVFSHNELKTSLEEDRILLSW